MGHSYNNGLHTTSKGITYDAVRITGLNVTPCVVAEDCKSGLISGVTRAVTGEYVFQLTVPYPPKVVVVLPTMSGTTTTTDLLHARYKDNSYNATTGQFTVLVSDDDDAGAPAAANGTAVNELHVLMAFNRYTR